MSKAARKAARKANPTRPKLSSKNKNKGKQPAPAEPETTKSSESGDANLIAKLNLNELGSNPNRIVEFSSTWRILHEFYLPEYGTDAAYAVGNNGALYVHVRRGTEGKPPSERYFREGQDGVELFLAKVGEGCLELV